MGNIYLVGFMGSGKSTVGKIVSKKTGMDFIDVDQLIEEKERKKIREIFKEKGEQYFRAKEKETLNEITSKKNLVVSTGGGLGADAENMKKMKQTGLVIWLDASIKTILERTKNDTDRPLLQQPYEKIKKLFEERKKIYRMADEHIKVDGKTPEEIAEVIIKRWKYIQE